MQNTKRVNFTVRKEIEILLRALAVKTGLKMSTIVERGIILFNKESK